MGQSIAVMNTKGGVGKSTIAMAIAETASVYHGSNIPSSTPASSANSPSAASLTKIATSNPTSKAPASANWAFRPINAFRA